MMKTIIALWDKAGYLHVHYEFIDDTSDTINYIIRVTRKAIELGYTGFIYDGLLGRFDIL